MTEIPWNYENLWPAERADGCVGHPETVSERWWETIKRWWLRRFPGTPCPA